MCVAYGESYIQHGADCRQTPAEAAAVATAVRLSSRTDSTDEEAADAAMKVEQCVCCAHLIQCLHTRRHHHLPAKRSFFPHKSFAAQGGARGIETWGNGSGVGGPAGVHRCTALCSMLYCFAPPGNNVREKRPYITSPTQCSAILCTLVFLIENDYTSIHLQRDKRQALSRTHRG